MSFKRDHFNTHHCVVRACLLFSKQNYNVYHVYFTNVFVCPTHFKRQSVKHIAYIALHRRVQVMLIRVRKIQVGHDTCPAYAGVSSLGVPGGTSRFWQIS